MIAFLLSAVAISLSGVMAPGPMTAATLAAGARSRHAGALVALGHAVVEMPLIFLLAAGMASFLDYPRVKIGIGLAGGAVLVLMGLQLLLSLRSAGLAESAPSRRGPLATGIMLTATNPYFLVWWATVGLALAMQSMRWGAAALLIFAVVHWLCDLVWLELLSVLAFKGSQLFGRRAGQVISGVCGIVLLGFGGQFIYRAAV
jgi:threonine/homoserine/homoserine lactone efflux protein